MNEHVNPPAIGHNNPPLADRLLTDHAALLAEADSFLKRALDMPKAVKSDADKGLTGTFVVEARAFFKKVDDTRSAEKQPFLDGGSIVDDTFRRVLADLKSVQKTGNEITSAYDSFVAQQERARKMAEARRLQQEEDERRAAAAKAEADGRREAAAKHEAHAAIAEDRRAEAEVAAAAPLAQQIAPTVASSGVRSTGRSVYVGKVVDWAVFSATFGPCGPYLKREHQEAALTLFIKQGGREMAGCHIHETIVSSHR